MVVKQLPLVLVPISIILLWQKEQYLKVLIGLLYVLLLSDSLQPIMSFAKNLKVVYMLLVGLLFVFTSNRINPKSKLFIIFLPFTIYSFLVLYNSGANFLTGLQKTISYAILLLAVPSILLKCIDKKGVAVLRDILYMALLVMIVGILIKYVNPAFVTRAGRFNGILGNPNGLGIYTMLFYLFFRVTNYFVPNAFSRQEKILIYFVIAYNLFFCASRTALGAVIFFYIAERLFRVSSFIAILSLFIGMFFIQYIFLYLPQIISTFGLDEYFRAQTLEEGSGRFIAWQFAWQKIQENFFIGGGFGYDEFVMRKNYATLSRLGHLGGVHNSYLSFWFDFGLIGLIIYFRSFIISFVRAHKKHIIALPLMFTVLFSITFESWLVASLNPFTIQLVLMLAAMLYLPDKNQIDNLSDNKTMA
jgi:O-antigen ligase